MCDKAVDNALPVSKFVPDWFVTNRTFENVDNVVFSNDVTDLDDIDSDAVTFFSDGVILLLQTFITLALMMIILIKVNLLILFLLDVLLDKVNLDNMRYVKNRQRINAYNMAYNKKARLVYEKKKEKL